MGLLQHAEVRLGVEGGIGDAHLRHADGHAHVAVGANVEEVVGHYTASHTWRLIAGSL